MFQVTPIGSCRVAGPLQLAQQRFGYAVNKARSYGYCHSSGEAVQLAKFMLGKFVPPPDIWPLVARGVQSDAINVQTHRPSDLYIVELSSSKRITIDGVFLQLNYVTSAFRAFFSDHQVARGFWAVAGSGEQDKIDAFLTKNCPETHSRDILRRVRIEHTTTSQLAADMRTLGQLLPRILFVTHVNARKPDGSALSSRSAFITQVKDAAHSCGATVFDPTQRMIEVGQQEAIADYSEGLAHYTDAFAQDIVTDWAALSIGPAIEDAVMKGDVHVTQDILVPYATARIKDGAFRDIDELLKRLIHARPEFDTLNELTKELCAAKNDAEGLYTKLDSTSADTKLLRQKLALGFDLGKFNDLSQLVIALESKDALPPTRQLLQMGRAAIDRGYTLVAMTILSAALDADPQHGAAADMLANLLLSQGHEALVVLPSKTLNALLIHVSPLLQLRLSDAGQWDHQIKMTTVTANDLVEIVAHLTLAADIPRAAQFTATWRSAQDQTPTLPSDLQRIIERWCVAAEKADDLCLKIKILNAVIHAHPQNNTARAALRDIRRMMRHDMRAAAADRDQNRLTSLADPNSLLPVPLTELDLYRARERFEAKDYASALKIGLDASRVLPNNISVWVLLMRAAAETDSLLDVDRFARRVIALSDRDTTRLETEAIDRMHRNATACGIAATSEKNRRKAAHLRKIAQRHTPVFRHTKARA